MHRTLRAIVTIGAVVTAAACSDSLSPNRNAVATNPALSAAFATVPTGFTNTQNTFDASAEGTAPWFPGAPHGGMGHDEGPGLGGGMHDMIGGGLRGDFLGGLGLGFGFGHGRRGDSDLDDGNCTFNAASGRVVCDPVVRDGITIVRSAAYTNAAGTAQAAFDSITTNSINTRVDVSGTRTRHDSATSTISSKSDRTVGGLAKGSTQHTVNGTAAGSETTNGKDSAGTFVAVRTAADTTRGVIIPVVTTGHTYPTAGTIIRVMTVTVTHTGQAAQGSNRREVVTYDGTATAHLVITQDGTTKTCTLPLPFGRPTCQ